MAEANYLETLGVNPVGFVDEQYVIELDVTPQHLNIGGIVHGGVICSLLDTALARSFFMSLPEENLTAATLEMKVNFLGSVKEGKLTAYGRVTHTTRRTAYVEGHVESEGGKLLAKGTATMMLFTERRVRE